MADLNELKQRLIAANLGLSDVDLRSPRELRVSMPRESLTGFADYLRAEVHARPELIVAEDTRSDAGAFTLRYIFEMEGAAGFAIASIRVPADDPTFPSLATRWYLATVQRDSTCLTRAGWPDLRRLPLHRLRPYLLC
jgi:Ni,Fe-hydrogenase III component G